MDLQEIISGCIRQERLSQKRLYEHFYGKMMGVCMRYTASRDEASEILNNGFYKVFKNMEQYDSRNGNFEGWVYRIMVNTAIDFYRKDFKHKYQDEVPTSLASHEEDAVSRMSAEEILSLVQKLSPAYRTVFNLFVIEGYSHADIAKMLNVTEGSSKSNLAKARLRLQEMIKKVQTHDNV